METYNDELMHYGVLGMKWGVRRSNPSGGVSQTIRRKRDDQLRSRSERFSQKSTTYSNAAKDRANQKVNGSTYLQRSERYMKKSQKAASKMSDQGKSVQNTTQYKAMTEAHRQAAERYVKRKTSQRVKDAVTSAAVSTGMSVAAMSMGVPYGVLLVNPGPKYDLKQSAMNLLDELYHADTEKHKYIAKVKVKGGKFRYFYDKQEYQNFLHPEKAVKNLADGVKKVGADLEKKASKVFDKKESKTTSTKSEDTGKNYVDTMKDRTIDGIALVYTKKDLERVADFLSKLNPFKKEDSKEPSKEESKNTLKPEKTYKYERKMELPNGKTVYFYDEDESIDYQKRMDYQKNEPDFMKDIPKIDENTVYTAEEDQEQVNPNYSPLDDEYSMNCIRCSQVYELRRRGYDVEAAPFDENDCEDQTLWGMETWYENLEQNQIEENGSITDIDKYTDDPNGMNKMPYVERNYTGESLRKALEENNPPNSRGSLNVYWKSGGGHSMVYEVDSKGKATIRDTQTNQIYDFDDVAPYCDMMFYARTDNLKLKEEILRNVKRKRK